MPKLAQLFAIVFAGLALTQPGLANVVKAHSVLESKRTGEVRPEEGTVSTAHHRGARIQLDLSRLRERYLSEDLSYRTWLDVEEKTVVTTQESRQSVPQEEKRRSPLQRLGVTVTVLSQFDHNTLVEGQEYQEYKNLVDFVGHQGKWNFGAQLRSLIYSDEMRVLPDDYEKPEKFGLYRRYLEYTGSGIQFRAGDFNQSLGNGITLYLQQDSALRLDHTIDGGRFGVRWKRLEALCLGGVIDQVTDEAGGIAPQLQATGNQDKLLALRVVGHLPLRATVGVNVNQFNYEGREATRQQTGSLEFRVPGLLNRFDVMGEFAVTRRWLDEPLFSLLSEHGRAIYLAATGYVLGGTTLIEYKNYRDMQSPYSNPPNLGRVDDVITNQDVRGFRARFDRTFTRTGTTAFFSYTQQNAVQSKAPFSFPLPNFNTLIFGGVEQSLQDDRWFIEAVVGRRYEKDFGLDEIHTTIDVNRRFWNRHSVGVNYDGRHTSLFLVREKDDRFIFSYGLSPYLIFSYLIARQQNVFKDTNDLLSEEYFSGPEVVFTPNSSWFIKVFVGSRPGGLVCSGGLCREENAFKGVRSSVSYRF